MKHQCLEHGEVGFCDGCLVDSLHHEIDHLETMNQRYIGKMQEQQDQIAKLKNQITCCRKENKALLAANTDMDRERNTYRDQAKTYKNRTELARSVADSYFMFNKDDPELTIKAMQRALIGTGGS